MKYDFWKIFFSLFLLFFSVGTTFGNIAAYPKKELKKLIAKAQTGDVIFIRSSSTQSDIVQAVTKSPYSHVGMIYKFMQNGEDNVVVYEASKIVMATPLKEFMQHALPFPAPYRKSNRYILKRFSSQYLKLQDSKNMDKLLQSASSFLGKPYDVKFEWGDDKIYCSELVWKVYAKAFTYADLLKYPYDLFPLLEHSDQNSPLSLVDAQTWGDFQTQVSVPGSGEQQLFEKRFGAGEHPDWRDLVVSPARLFESPFLQEVP